MATATGTVLVASGSSVQSITHNLNFSSCYVTALVASWNTTTWVGTRALNATTVHFGTQIGSGGGQLDWRAET